MRNAIKAYALLLLITAGSAGCGLKGDLYLPEDTDIGADAEAQPAATNSEDEDKDDSKPNAETDDATSSTP